MAANVIALSKRPRRGSEVREIRNEYGFSLSQAAAALQTSATTLETWEANPGMGPDTDFVRTSFETFLIENGPGGGKNLLFGIYPLRVAREILGLTVEQMAVQHGYATAVWQKFEANRRKLNLEKLTALEKSVRRHFLDACNKR